MDPQLPPFALWLSAFLWTCALEIPLYMLLLRRQIRPWWRAGLLALGLQVATHPLLWYAFPRFAPYETWLVVAEAWVLLVETLLVALSLRLRPTPARALGRALAVAFAANAVSAVFGLIKQALGSS